MIFGQFPCDEAAGIILAHSLSLGGRSLRKGRVLSAEDVAELRRAGLATVWGARLEPGDVAEDQAAGEIAALLGGEGVGPRAPYTGRCNLHAHAAGVLLLDRERLDRLNLLDEAITVGTLPPHAVVRKGQVVATVKIIPFAVRRGLIDAWRAIAASAPLLRVAPFRPRRAALILSELPGMKDSVLRGTVGALRRRLEGLSSRLALELRGPHEVGALAALVRRARAAGCDLILLSGATVTKDRGDVAPAAIVAAGGAVEHFGMPVEPGNMLLLARLGEVPVLVLPGCARSRRLNGLDWVLQRLAADLPVTREEIMRMGVGGLIRSPLEPEDEEEAADEAPVPPPAGPKVAVVVLAAGRSTRMQGANKLLAEVDGVPMVARAACAALASRAAEVLVVTGHEAERVAAALTGCPVRLVHNPDYGAGLSTSLRAGLAALAPDTDAAIVMLADMPRIGAGHLDRLMDAFDPAAPQIVVPCHDGRRGNPILWPRGFFGEMQRVTGDQGARELLTRHAGRIKAIETDEAVFADVDTPDALEQARARQVGA
ncbi:MAG: NTP transferase domain-containing protein [Pseudomonadota bacterium]